MYPTYQLRALFVAVILCCFWTQPTTATLQLNNNPAVKEFGAADAALVLCFDKTVYAHSYSPTSLAHIAAKNINYVKVETLNPGINGGVDAEVTGGAIKKPNIVITLTDGGRKVIFKSNSGSGHVLNNNRNLVVQFGTYDAMFQECFYQKLYSGMISPQSVTFNNPAAKAINFIIVESDQEIAIGGITAALTSGAIGDKAITVQITSTPHSGKFLNNFEVKMFCEK
uniref:Farnesoic acid O-methyl transferase domain-containing protein n=1 Tax=Anopheles culicifacies TaxID=139723 RepID=A0A182MN89_9DIPT